ncbi:hypothetical protein ACFXA6_13435, partial [Streptomyces mirabilis]
SSLSGGGAGWVSPVLPVMPPLPASPFLPFVIERPDELRDLVVALADRLVDSARRRPPDVRPVP